MITLNKFLNVGFYIANIALIILYLYPGSILGCYFYNDCTISPKITEDFMISSNYLISSNHFYIFTILSILGIFTQQNTNKIKFLIIYLFLLSIILELLHIIIPLRAFEWNDLFGNILGVISAIVIYRVKNRYV